MSLKTFHIVFITLSSALAFAFGVWAVGHDGPAGGGAMLPALGIVSLAAGAGLIVYGVWFLRKIRTAEEEKKRRRGRFRSVTALVPIPLLVLGARDALACSVCYGDAEGPLLDAARMGVWLLFGLVFAVQVSFASFFIVLWKRARSHRRQHDDDGASRPSLR